MPHGETAPSEELAAVECHVGVERCRFATSPVERPDLPEDTVSERREHAVDSEEIGERRRLLGSEPRGHASMYGPIIVPPDDPGAHFWVPRWAQGRLVEGPRARDHRSGVQAMSTGRVACRPVCRVNDLTRCPGQRKCYPCGRVHLDAALVWVTVLPSAGTGWTRGSQRVMKPPSTAAEDRSSQQQSRRGAWQTDY